METVKYYDRNGNIHTVRAEQHDFGEYAIYLDEKFYAHAEDRIKLDYAVCELITYKKFTHARPKKTHNNTSPVPAIKMAE